MGMGGGPVDPHATGSCVRCGGQGCADCGQPRDDPEYQHPAAMDDPASFDHPTLDRAATTDHRWWWVHSSTIPTPAGKCWRCGGQLYENLTHSCATGYKP